MVTVIIPAYNCANYIGKAIESVMEQDTTEEIEIMIIDDGSTDQTKQVVQSYMNRYATLENVPSDRSIAYFSNGTNKGVAESRNVGIRGAQGSFLAFLDADDWWSKDKLSRQLDLIRKEKAVLVYSGRELMHQNGHSTGKILRVPQQVTYRSLLHTNSIPCSSVVMRTEVAREFYMCHDELHEDYIMWLRVLRKYGKGYGIDAPMLKSRLAENGKSRNKVKSAKMQIGVYQYLKLPFYEALWYFVSYTIHGFIKYRGIKER